jgi:hypothetical protein
MGVWSSMNASPEQSTLLCISDASTFVVGSYTWKAVSDRDTLEDLSQSPRSPFKHDRKLLILNGEMSEWLKEHAWKAWSFEGSFLQAKSRSICLHS